MKRPEEEAFHATCNEFWWRLNNVAKGIARDELTYAVELYNRCVRDMLSKMLEWRIGAEINFAVSMGKYFKKFLAPETYERLRATYAPAGYAALWEAVFCMCALFGDTARSVAARLGYAYHQEEESNAMVYLRTVRADATPERFS